MKKRAYKLMKQWCDALLTYQVNTHSPYTNNSLLCPACHVIHGRIADLCFPLTAIWRSTKDEKYLKKADELIDWSEYNLITPDGLWYNDAGNHWIGTSAFSALSIGEALYHFGDTLPEKYKTKWLSVFVRITNAVFNLDKNESFRPVSNYYCGFAAVLAMRACLTGESVFRDKAKIWADAVSERFDENGILFGEGYPMTADDGSRTVDMGYNLEESIPLLLRYATLTGDNMEFFKERLLDHLYFLLPDGAIDNSFGSRHNKWTYWGSRTSDGLAEGLALVLDEPVFYEACESVLSMYEKCTHDGLFAMPMAHEAHEPTCLHHTFTHAKALAALSVHEDVPSPCKPQLPCKSYHGIKEYQNGRLLLVSNNNFRATFSAINAGFLPDHAANGGGSMNLLYHRSYGPICAATSAEYIPSEPLNQQYQRNSDKYECMTAQFEVGGKYACKDKSVRLASENMTVTASAEFWQAKYTVNEDSVDILLISENAVYNLPIVCGKSTVVNVSDDKHSVTIGNSLSVVSDTSLNIDGNKRVFNQVGGLMYLPISVDVKGTVSLSVKVSQ